MEITALPPTSVALRTSRSIAWRRVSSSSSVYSWISPPPMERSPAMMLPPRPRLRTTSPKTIPFVSTTRQSQKEDRDDSRHHAVHLRPPRRRDEGDGVRAGRPQPGPWRQHHGRCLLYTSDAADDLT